MRARMLRGWLVWALVACGGPKIAPPVADTTAADASAAETAAADAETAAAPAEIADTSAADTSLPDLPPTEVADAAPADSATVDAQPVDAAADASCSACPVAVIKVLEGGAAIPQSEIHLTGVKSYSPCGLAIKKYKWTVKQPAGSNQALTPNASFANPTLLANVAGEYQFCLEVWDEKGVKSCQADCFQFLVIPTNAVHIELLWDTPGDPDQTDNGPAAGADLDLHFAHPLASKLDLDCDGKPDPWFSNPWDVFWYNPAPKWGDPNSVKDDPTLDLDDTDGAGPENLNVIEPEGNKNNPVAYSIGVHYWDDHGYGDSLASVVAYVQGGKVLALANVKMQKWDFWYVGKLNWPNAKTGGQGEPVTLCYQGGDSCAAGKDLTWQPKGDWCVTKCYYDKNLNLGGAVAGKPAWCP